MSTPRTLLALALSFGAPLLLGACNAAGKKSDGTGPAASTSAPPVAAAACPGGSTLSGTRCNATGTSRVAIIKWYPPPIGAQGPRFSVTNTSQMTLRSATVSLWFYDKTGKRLDVVGTKKYSSATDAFGSTPLKPGAPRDLNLNFSLANVPTGTAEIEAEVVTATHNDDLNADERVMVGPVPAPPATAPTTAPAVVAPTATWPAGKPRPVPPR
jgi:hypothetical protein